MKKPWLGVQSWKQPVFMHWPVAYDVLRLFVPAPFQLDTFQGQAWVSIVPFEAQQTHPRWGSGLLSLGPLWQLNVRTYIRFFEEPAVYFLKVFTNSRLSVMGARTLLSLPFENASFDTSRHKDRIIFNMQQPNRQPGVHFSAHVNPSSDPFYPGENTLEHWLTERYHFYAIKGNNIVKASISHTPWRLQASSHAILNHNLHAFIPGDKKPLVHVADSLATYLYPFETKGRYFR